MALKRLNITEKMEPSWQTLHDYVQEDNTFKNGNKKLSELEKHMKQLQLKTLPMKHFLLKMQRRLIKNF